MSYADLKGERGALWTSRVDMGEVHVYRDLVVGGNIVCDNFQVPMTGADNFTIGQTLLVRGNNLADDYPVVTVLNGCTTLQKLLCQDAVVLNSSLRVRNITLFDSNVTINNDLYVNGTIHWKKFDPQIQGGGGAYPRDAIFDNIAVGGIPIDRNYDITVANDVRIGRHLDVMGYISKNGEELITNRETNALIDQTRNDIMASVGRDYVKLNGVAVQNIAGNLVVG